MTAVKLARLWIRLNNLPPVPTGPAPARPSRTAGNFGKRITPQEGIKAQRGGEVAS